MSLHKFAEQVAAHGRGDDSLLVHMTPDEVQRLQKFAEANGRSLTINPHTGLPEAGFLSDLFKAVAPIALGAFLGPAGAAFGGGFMSAGAAGLLTGGITTLATGSLSRGLMAGLGAYGGANLATGLESAGAGALEAGATSAAQGQLGAANLALGEAMPEQAAKQFTQDAVSRQVAAATPLDKFGAGLGSITSSPEAAGAFAKDNWKSLAAASAPIMAGAMVPTTTTMPKADTNPAYIRQKLYDPYTQTYKSLAPVKASEWGGRSFSDAYTNPQTGEMATLQPRAPGMADGGIVALAIGGDTKAALEQAYAANDVAKINELVSQNKITAEDVGSTWKGFDTSGIAGLNLYNPAAEKLYQETGSWDAAAKARDDAANAANAATWNQQNTDKWNAENQAKWAAQPVQYTENQMGAYLTAHPEMTIDEAIKATNADRTAVNKFLANTAGGFKGSTDTTGGSGTLGIYNQWNAMGVSPDEYYAAAIANNPKYAGWTKEDITRGFNLDKGAYALAAAEKDGVSDKEWVNFMDTNKYSVNDMAQAFGLSKNEVQRRYDAVKNAEKKTTVTGTGGTGAGGVGGPPTTTVLPTNPQTNAPPGTKNPYGNVNNPGDLTYNADGTITVQPNIPGRPYGGFSGMDEVKNAYTAGGGSLGYTSPVPKTMADFESMYNKQTGDSMAAYNYLMGKGGAKYPIQSTAASSAEGIMRPYWSAGMKYKPKFLSYGKDGTIQSSTTSGGTAADTKVGDLTKAKSIYILDNQGNSVEATLGADGNYYTSGGDAYDVTGKQVQTKAEGGMTGYAMGGGLGSLGSYSDGGRLLKGPGDGVSDSIPATIGDKQQPARLADGEFVVPARIVSELGNGSTEAGAKKLYAMMDRVQKARGKTTGKNKVAANSRADKYLPA